MLFDGIALEEYAGALPGCDQRAITTTQQHFDSAEELLKPSPPRSSLTSAADMGAAIARILRPGISRLRTIAFKDYYDDINVPVNLSDSAIFTLAATALRAHPRLKIVVEEAPSYQQPGNVMLPPRLRLLALPDDLRGRIVTRMGDCSDLNSLRELLGPPSFLPGGSDEEKPRA